MNTSQELKKEVEVLIEGVNKTHRYSVSKIYAMWNRVFEKKEQPQTCASCLIRKVRDLRQWLELQNMQKRELSEVPPVKPKATRKKK